MQTQNKKREMRGRRGGKQRQTQIGKGKEAWGGVI
jgi:hypothetical protein